MFKRLRRLWIKFELWKAGYCTKHGIPYVWHANEWDSRGLTTNWKECPACDTEAQNEAKRRREEEQRELSKSHLSQALSCLCGWVWG